MSADQWEGLLSLLQQNPLVWRIISLTVIGTVAGTLTSLVLPHLRVGGTPGTLILGVFSAVMGGWACALCGFAIPAGVSLPGIGAAFVTAVLLLVAARGIARM